MEDTFDIGYWLNQGEEPPKEPVHASQPHKISNPRRLADIITVKDRIVAQGKDITFDREDWLRICFALAFELGEAGREIFHEVSQFYPDYTRAECDKQYDACLKGHGSVKATGSTFFEIAKKHGIDINTRPAKLRNSVDSAVPQQDNLPAPSFSDDLFPILPEFLQKVVCKASNEKEGDILLLGAIGVISGALPNFKGVYDDTTIFPNLCIYITGQASAGKGRLKHVRRIVKPIHDELRKEYDNLKDDYESKMIQYEKDKRNKNAPTPKKPDKPPQKMLIIPGNTSATAVIQILHDNGGTAIIFETEGDVLASSFNNDYGNYSESFRCAFHHEPFGYHRRGGDEHVEVEEPKLSAVLSGTPEQIRTLIKSPENGLFSRFGFYFLVSDLDFKNVFKRSEGVTLNQYFDSLGEEYLEFYHALQTASPLEFSLTEDQENTFLDFFSESQADLFIDFGDGILATIRRLAVICYRICMVLTALRVKETGNFYENPVCSDDDFESAMTISKALIKHATKVYCELFGEHQQPRLSSTVEQKFLDALPENFGRPEYIEAAKSLGINPRTAEGYISKFCLKKGTIERISYGKYHKKT